MTSILEILLRNIMRSSFYEIEMSSDRDERVTRLLSYINEHISEPHLLKVEQLAKTFKRYTDMSVREFKKQGEYRSLKRSSC